MIVTAPQCYGCKHFIDNQEKPTCSVFEVIPLEIWLGEFDHRQPYPGDNGIQFEPIDDKDKGKAANVD